MLGLFVGKDLQGDSLTCPEPVTIGQENLHPQLAFYQLQIDRLSMKRQQLDTRLLPTLSAFGIDRKSTRLNSSHANISYAVFCLKQKKCQPLQHHGFC